jgi:pyruvate-formate lyase-activating enzyme
MRTIEIQGVKVPIKEQYCILNDANDANDATDATTLSSEPISPYVSINVYITNDCNGSCKFCCNVNNDSFVFDFDKFKDFIYEIRAITPQIEIRKVTFTGGEPSLDLNNLHKCIGFLRNACCDTKIVICTNGTFLQQFYYYMFFQNLEYGIDDCQKMVEIIESVNSISMSRHHWDNTINNEILGLNFDLYMMDILKHVSALKEKMNLSCNLIRGYVDSPDKMVMMLEYADSLGIGEVAFVKLMPINDYCEKNKIEINALQDDANLLGYEKWKYPKPNVCECMSYVYRSKANNLIKFYMRNNKCPTYNMGSYIIYKRNVIQNWY